MNFILIGVTLLLTVFPLYTRNKYFDILASKYNFFWMVSLAAIVLTLAAGAVHIIRGKNSFAQLIQKCKLDAAEKMILIFWGVCGISTLCSEYRYEAFWGNEGRLCGFFFLSVACMLYIAIKRKLQFQPWLIQIFLVSSLLVALWGITDFVGMDLFGFRANIANKTNYTSSFGNINTYTSFIVFIVAISAVLFTDAKDYKKTIWYGGCLFISLIALITGMSDNAYLALGGLLALLPYYVAKKYRRLVRYGYILAICGSSFLAILGLESIFAEQIVPIGSLYRVVVSIKVFPILVVCAWLIVVFFDRWVRKKQIEELEARWVKKLWSGILLAAIAVILFLLCDANLWSDSEKYGALSSYLKLSDSWGEGRMYVWKLTFSNYRELSLVHKLFGYGLETFGIFTVTNNYDNMVQAYGVIFENAHNEYLQYFFTIGPIGLAAYLGVLICSVRSILKKSFDNPYAVGLAFSVICYAIQATVNIAVPLVYPFVWIFLAMGLSIGRKEEVLNDSTGVELAEEKQEISATEEEKFQTDFENVTEHQPEEEQNFEDKGHQIIYPGLEYAIDSILNPEEEE